MNSDQRARPRVTRVEGERWAGARCHWAWKLGFHSKCDEKPLKRATDVTHVSSLLLAGGKNEQGQEDLSGICWGRSAKKDAQ